MTSYLYKYFFIVSNDFATLYYHFAYDKFYFYTWYRVYKCNFKKKNTSLKDPIIELFFFIPHGQIYLSILADKIINRKTLQI